MKSLIYGYGKTGKSFARFLESKEYKFDIYDDNLPKYSKKIDLKKYNQILCSPGIPKNIFEKITNINKNVLTDLDIFFQEDTSIKIGITGTNRKSTTAFHLYQLFEKFEPANLIGNIGNPMLDYINTKKYSIIELSSFQLDKMITNKLDFGILLNIQTDHLDYHGNFEFYKLAKERILDAKKSISFEDNPYDLFEWITGQKSSEINLKNLPYRFQHISKNIINDSKSTNYHSLSYAVKRANEIFLNNGYVLIVCGSPKKEEFRKIDIKGPDQIYIFGKHAKEIDKCFNNKNKKVFNELSDVVNHLNKHNQKNVLFSPGYPSGDDFSNFEDRGVAFNKIFGNLNEN